MTNKQSDPFDLQRFVDAQNTFYEDVCAELRNGQKRICWMARIEPLAGSQLELFPGAAPIRPC